MMNRNVWILALGMPLMIGLLLVVPGSPSVAANTDQPSPTTPEISVDNFSFGPRTITVAVATTVTWTNHDDMPHTVVSTDGAFKSKVLDTGEKFSYTFAKRGTYTYFCSMHPAMTGQVVVQ